jgi:hypothetical protein
MATVTLLPHRRFQQGVREAWPGPKLADTFVVAMAGNAILLQQFLMERESDCLGRNRLAVSRLQPDFRKLVTGSALASWSACERLVASETIGRALDVPLDERPWCDHELGVDERERRHRSKIGQQHKKDDPFHRQPQKTSTLTMCPIDSTANTKVIGKCTTRHCRMRSNVIESQNIACSISSFDRPRI